MQAEWPYFRLRKDGVLVYDDNGIPLAIDRRDGSTPYFSNIAEAEQWLIDNDIRGNVIDDDCYSVEAEAAHERRQLGSYGR